MYLQFLLSFDYLVDLSDSLISGISIIECIKARLKLMAMREGLSESISNNNSASMVERVTIAVSAVLITEDDLNEAICLVCGSCPKIVSSDGNSKDTIHLTENLVYDFDSTEDVPSLYDFKTRLARQMLRSSFFQNEEKEKFNMVKLPIIMAPKLLKSQVNNSETMAALSQLIRKREIDILTLGKVFNRYFAKLSLSLF